MELKAYLLGVIMCQFKLEFGATSIVADKETRAADMPAVLEKKKKMVPQSRFNSISMDVGRPCHDGLLPATSMIDFESPEKPSTIRSN